MDFGDILDQWDRQTGKSAGKKAVKAELERLPAENTAGEESGDKGSPSSQKVDPLTAWLRIYGVPNKDAEIAETGVPHSKRRRRLRAKKADAALDLTALPVTKPGSLWRSFSAPANSRNWRNSSSSMGRGFIPKRMRY